METADAGTLQDIANLLSALYDPTDPEWTASMYEYTENHLDDPTLQITLKSAYEYNRTFEEDLSRVLQ